MVEKKYGDIMSIQIPESLSLKRNKASEARLNSAARKWLEKEERTDGIHASDLLDIRQAFWKHKQPGPITDRQVPIFLIGKILHAFVLGSMGGDVDIRTTDEGSVYSEELGIWYSVDWDRSGDMAEFKSARFFNEPQTTSDLESYIEQLLVYMVAKKRTSAQLWLLLLNLRDENRKTSPAFRAYTITISEDDLVQLTASVQAQRVLLVNALKSGDSSALPLCRAFKCGGDNCEYYDQCRPEGRFGQPRWDGKGLAKLAAADPGPAVEMPATPEVPGPTKTKRGRKVVGA